MGISERKRRETEELRRRVLDAAEDIFVREGADRVTMRRIAARVEYAPTLLYRLFANKTDLMEHLIARGYEGVRASYERVRRRKAREPRAALTALLQAYVHYALDHPNHYRMWFDTGVLSRQGRGLQMSHGRLQYTVFQPWLDGIQACQKAGQFPGRTPLEVFQILWSRVHGMISLRLQHPGFRWMPLSRQLGEVLDL